MIIGGKPMWLMRALVRDYSRPGNLVCDPCAGGATTLIAAAIEKTANILMIRTNPSSSCGNPGRHSASAPCFQEVMKQRCRGGYSFVANA